MSELVREGDELVLKLSLLEKVEGVHGDLRFPRSAVRSVKVLDDAVRAVHGLKLPGSRWPGAAMGTFMSFGSKTFAMVHNDTKRGLNIELSGAAYDTLVVGAEDPEGLAASLGFRHE